MLYPTINFDNFSPTLEDLVTSGYQVFDETWGTYVPEHKTVLCGKILRAYWYYQIGQDTPDRFRHYLNQRLDLIMPYYNQLYKSELLKIDPLINHYLSTDGHTVKDLFKEATKANSAVGKAIRDFANSAKDTTDFKGNLAGAYETVSSRDIHSDSQEDGERDKTTDRTETINRTENETIKVIENKTTDQSTTENETANTKTVEDNSVTLDSTENETTNRTIEATMEDTKKETVATTGSGDSTTNETMNQSTNTRKDYADTPQKQLTSGSIRSDYLTNVTWNDEDTDRTTNTTVNNSYEENKTTDTTENKTENTTDNTTRELTRKDQTAEAKDKTEDLTRDVKGTLNETVDTTTDTTRDLTVKQDETENTTEKEGWGIHKTETTDDDYKENKGTNEDTKSNQIGEHFDNGSSNETTSTASSQDEKAKQSDTEKTAQKAQGFINVSQSDLLTAFRSTFLNIDRLVIEELRDCFMEVF